MSLQTDIKEGIKASMLARDSVRTETLRGIVAAITNELVAKGLTPQSDLPDDAVLAVIARLVKQRKDSITQFQAGGRDDLVKEEQAQLAILETFLPAQMTRDEIEKIAKEKIGALGADKGKSGVIVGMLMKDLKGKADGMVVKEVVESLLV